MKKILLAEDDETSRLSIARLLELAGYECIAVCDGVAGKEALQTQEFDCVISDLNMQGNSDLEFIRSVPKIQPGLSVIVTTGYPSVETAVASLKLPVLAYLTKPVKFEELAKHVCEAVVRQGLLRQFNKTRVSLEEWRSELAKLVDELKESPRAPMGDPVDVYVMVTYRNILASLLGLRTVVEQSLSIRPQAEPNVSHMETPLLLIDALRDAIAVLEKTKDSFRSRDLGDLRHRLEELLETSRER